jgi:biopolymer transport protein ExbD
MRRIEPNMVEVDMIPMIDIISLLLMFLIVVGSTAVEAEGVQMRLPRADQALQVRGEGRIVIQVYPRGGKYWANINNKDYELLTGARNQTLQDYLKKQVEWALEKGLARREGLDEAVNIPVKLRIPEGAPMKEVEKVVLALSDVRLTNIQYAAQNAPVQ